MASPRAIVCARQPTIAHARTHAPTSANTALEAAVGRLVARIVAQLVVDGEPAPLRRVWLMCSRAVGGEAETEKTKGARGGGDAVGEQRAGWLLLTIGLRRQVQAASSTAGSQSPQQQRRAQVPAAPGAFLSTLRVSRLLILKTPSPLRCATGYDEATDKEIHNETRNRACVLFLDWFFFFLFLFLLLLWLLFLTRFFFCFRNRKPL